MSVSAVCFAVQCVVKASYSSGREYKDIGRASKRVVTWVRTAGSLERTAAVLMQSVLNLSSLSEKWLLCSGKRLTD